MTSTAPDADVERAELGRIAALHATIASAEAQLMAALGEARNPPPGSGRPRLRWEDLATACGGIAPTTLQTRLRVHEQRRAARAGTP